MSNSGPFQASVASTLSTATRIASPRSLSLRPLHLVSTPGPARHPVRRRAPGFRPSRQWAGQRPTPFAIARKRGPARCQRTRPLQTSSEATVLTYRDASQRQVRGKDSTH
jgi:hypothetical protein